MYILCALSVQQFVVSGVQYFILFTYNADSALYLLLLPLHYVMTLSDDFSTNRHVVGFERPLEVVLPPRRHPDLCFDDGNIAVLSGSYYFIIHQGLVCRHSAPLATAIKELNDKPPVFLETRPVLELCDSINDLFCFLRALYDGV